MGGSFNPIHCRHLQIALGAQEEMKLERVLFIPNGNPPHKHTELANAAHRYEMTRLAIMPFKPFAISDIEMTRGGVMYTVDTLKLLAKQYTNADLFMIIGEDALFELEHWRQPLEVFQLCSFIVCPREHQDLDDHPYVQSLRTMGARLSFLSLEPQDISASDIRGRIADGSLGDNQIPAAVHEYIRIMGLYGCTASLEGGQAAYAKLKAALCDDRLLHTLATAYTARRLALIHQLDAEACELAGLLHDCAKCMDLKSMQQIAHDAKLQLSDIEFKSVGLLHGPVGAVIAETEYGVHCRDILTAIATHTTGYAGMSAFDMVVFLADKIEPYRYDIQELAAIRALAEQDLLKAMYRTLLNAKQYASKKNYPLHPATEETIQWVQNQIQ